MPYIITLLGAMRSMNKNEFLAALRAGLDGLPQGDIDNSVEYYSEMIDDRMEDGLTEQEAVAAVGELDAILQQILGDASLTQLVRVRAKRARALTAWEIILLILGSPIWLPLGLAAVAVALSLYIVAWAIIVSLYAVDLSLAAAWLGCWINIFICIAAANPTAAVFSFGIGLACAGLAVLSFFGFNQITKGLVTLSKKLMHKIKVSFIKKEAKA